MWGKKEAVKLVTFIFLFTFIFSLEPVFAENETQTRDSSGGADNICDGKDDGICDPDCHFSADPDCSLDLTNFIVLAINNTEVILELTMNNFWNETLSNVSWSLFTNQSSVYSSENISLEVNESIFVYIGYNFSSIGNYTLVSKIQSGELKDIEELYLEVT